MNKVYKRDPSEINIPYWRSPKPKSLLKIGKEMSTVFYTDVKFNKWQKKMWKFLLNIEIKDVE